MTHLGFLLKWVGTRVYLKLEQRWNGKVKGLCGNYNYDAGDDFTSPSNGVESDPVIFGHTWRLDDSCMSEDFCVFFSDFVPKAEICVTILLFLIHLQLRQSSSTHANWILSDTFGRRKSAECWNHQYSASVIRLFPMKASTNDAFSMRARVIRVSLRSFDESMKFYKKKKPLGGDCECLCTALSAYAHACAANGVFIKWRTPELCRKLCDEEIVCNYIALVHLISLTCEIFSPIFLYFN